MSPFFAVFLVLLLGSSSYAAGRLHGQLSYRVGYRFGYRQGYFDGDRGAWNRRRQDAQAAVASVLAGPSTSSPENVAAMETPGAMAPVSVPPGPPMGVPASPTGVSGAPMGVPGPTTGLVAPGPGAGTTYTGSSFAGTATNGGRHSTDVLTGGKNA